MCLNCKNVPKYSNAQTHEWQTEWTFGCCNTMTSLAVNCHRSRSSEPIALKLQKGLHIVSTIGVLQLLVTALLMAYVRHSATLLAGFCVNVHYHFVAISLFIGVVVPRHGDWHPWWLAAGCCGDRWRMRPGWACPRKRRVMLAALYRTLTCRQECEWCKSFDVHTMEIEAYMILVTVAFVYVHHTSVTNWWPGDRPRYRH